MSAATRETPAANFSHSTGNGRKEWRTSEPRLPLFTVSKATDEAGEPELVTYTYPSKPNSGLALEFLRTARNMGAELAISWLIEEAIGVEGYDALVEELETYEGDGQATLRAMGEKLQKSVMGGLEGPKA